MGKDKPKRRVVDYYMSLHYGVCAKVDSILEIRVKDKAAWAGNLTTNAALAINQPMLFGGNEKEGGVVGTAQVLMGADTQTMPEHLAARLGRTTATCPGFRDLTSIFFHGTGEPRAGFMWGQNNPYLPPVSVKARRMPVGLSPTYREIARGGTVDANPVHMIFECYTNADWGLGFPQASFNMANWEAVAQAVHAEQFGLSMIWVRQTEVEKFVAEIQDHIQAMVYENPATGLLEIKLIRGDYDLATALEFNPDNCDLVNPERRSLEDTTNEIIITWTDPESEEDATVTFQDLANIAAQGGRIISDNRNYYGIRNPDLAAEVGQRDLRMASYPLFAAEIVTNRVSSKIAPGIVVKLNWPEWGIVSMPVRIMAIDTGAPGSGSVRLNVVEDIFGLEQGVFSAPAGSLWVNPSVAPRPFDTQSFLTLPYPALQAAGVTLEYPETLAGILAQQGDDDTFAFTLTTEVTLADGTTAQKSYDGKLQTPFATLAAALVQEALSVVAAPPFGTFLGDPVFEAGAIFRIGDLDGTSELVMLSGYDSVNKTWNLVRGLYDTVPKAWAAGAVVWQIVPAFSAVDTNVRIEGVSVNYWLRPQTSQGVLALADAPLTPFTPTDRPHLPFRPANLVIDGNGGFGTVLYETAPVNSTIPVTWATRNRLTEDAVALRWTEAAVAGETGQTHTLRAKDPDGLLIKEYPGLTGNSFDLPWQEVATNRFVTISLHAVRDGFESMQAPDRLVEFRLSGYGFSYGYDYGGKAV